MHTERTLQRGFFAFLFLILVTPALVYTQNSRRGNAVMWSRVDISKRDLFYGPGGRTMAPNFRRVTFIKRDTGGNNLKYRIKDAAGREWVAKIADESRPEVAAVRLLWGVGYRTEINYLVPRLTIPGKGTFRNVSVEARPANVDRDGRWSWKDNPFVGTNEFEGLKIMMALINNWDLKDDNNAIFVTGRERQYVVSDLGSSFGKLAPIGLPILNRFGRSVDRPEHFFDSDFVKGIEEDGDIDFAYKAKAKGLYDHISPAQGRWIAGLLGRLSDRQISDAFRAANYSPEEIRLLTTAVRGRIKALTVTTDLYEAVR